MARKLRSLMTENMLSSESSLTGNGPGVSPLLFNTSSENMCRGNFATAGGRRRRGEWNKKMKFGVKMRIRKVT